MYVSVKRGSNPKWGYAIETVVAGMMKMFIVQSFSDREKLATILRRYHLANEITIRIEKNPRTTRYNNLKFPKTKGLETVLDQLIFTNDVVFNTIVSVTNIEGIVIVPSSNYRDIDPLVGADHKFKDNIHHVVAENGDQVRIFGQGNRATDVNRGKYSRILKAEGAPVADNSDLIIQKQAAISEEKERLIQLQETEKHALNSVNDCKRRVDQIENELRRIQSDMKAENKRKTDLNENMQEFQEASAIDTSDLENEERDIEAAIESLERQLPDVNNQLNDLNNDLKSKQDEKKKLDKKRTEIDADIHSIELELSNCKENIENAEQRLRAARRDADTKNKLVQSISGDLSKKDAELEKQRYESEEGTMKLLKTVEDNGTWEGQPLQLGKNDSFDTIKKEIEKMKKKEEEEKKKHGLQGRTEAEVSDRYRNAKADYDASKSEYKSLQLRSAQLEADYIERKNKWTKGLKNSTRRVKKYFDQYLNLKGLSGKAKFDHSEHTLQLVARTDNLDVNTTCTDVRQLSGGEKSFTTLCLLFALGHVSECPFRLMDEYDVFMDEGTRKLTLQMLIDYALNNSQKSRQFIIITPNNLNHVKTNSNIKIIQMQPPDRRERSAAGGPRQRTLEETF